MKWLDRLREKNPMLTPMPLTKLTEGNSVSAAPTFVSVVRASSRGSEVFVGPDAESLDNEGPLDATAPHPKNAESASKVNAITVPYQRVWFDWDLSDRSYTPEQLRQAKMLVKAWGPVQSYPITIADAWHERPERSNAVEQAE